MRYEMLACFVHKLCSGIAVMYLEGRRKGDPSFLPNLLTRVDARPLLSLDGMSSINYGMEDRHEEQVYLRGRIHPGTGGRF